MPGAEERKAAVATADGANIYEHFAGAPSFLVIKVRDHQVVAREWRENPHGGCVAENDGHARCLQVAVEVLPDVHAVICAGMGKNAYVALLSRNILPLPTQERDIKKAVKLYIKGRLKEDTDLVGQPGKGGCT